MRGANGEDLAVRGWQTPTTKITTTYRASGVATKTRQMAVMVSQGYLMECSIYGATAHAQGTG